MINLNKLTTTPDDSVDRKKTEDETEKFKDELFDLQNVLFAEHKHSLLVILQGIDASGKDGTVKHVFSSMNPMGVNVKAFKAPTEEELQYDFLWRVHKNVPAKGMIQIFNRSHYEDILVPTVHKELEKDLIERRYDIINSFEQNLVDSGTVILKFYLHISKSEQKERIGERLTKPSKRWKYDPGDKREALKWDDYIEVYEEIFDRCSKKNPWIIVPSDSKWYRNYIVAKEIRDTLKGLKLKYPS